MSHPTNEQDEAKTGGSSKSPGNHSSIFHRNQSQQQRDQPVLADPSTTNSPTGTTEDWRWRRFLSHPMDTAQEYVQRLRGRSARLGQGLPPDRSVASSSSTSSSRGGGTQPSSSTAPPQQSVAATGLSAGTGDSNSNSDSNSDSKSDSNSDENSDENRDRDRDRDRDSRGSSDAALVVRRLEALEAEVSSLRSQLAKKDMVAASASASEEDTTTAAAAAAANVSVPPAASAWLSPAASVWSSWVAWCGGWVAWWGTGASRAPSLSEAEGKVLDGAKSALGDFCARHRIDPSHGERHALQVLDHAKRALTAASAADKAAWGENDSLAILLAALLHDVDDHKYFPRPCPCPCPCPPVRADAAASTADGVAYKYPNARAIMETVGVPESTVGVALAMIDLVGCSSNGNGVPPHVARKLHYLIPRWADRLEAVGAIGVVRCYQYTKERGQPLSSASSPRPQTAEEVWLLATPARFEAYQASGGSSADMISHYFDKLLHIARPPVSVVQNAYLERAAEGRAAELVEVCVRFGRTGQVDEEYIRSLETRVSK